jgi:hypothetical protein
MSTRAAVELYAGAGDAVVTNPAGDVGVKFYPEPGAREKLRVALRSPVDSDAKGGDQMTRVLNP